MSADVIDLGKKRDERFGPSPEFKVIGPDGRAYYSFAIEYYHSDGKTYSFYVWALDWSDAEARVAAVRETAGVIGQVYESGEL